MEQIRLLLEPRIQLLFQESIITMQPVAKAGEVNLVFAISTPTRKIIARVNDVSELDRFKKEQWCIKQATQAGVKGAEVLDLGSNDEYAYMLMPYIEGKRADQEGVDVDVVWRMIGEYAKKIHNIAVEGFGENLEDMASGNLKKWRDYLEYNISSLGENDPLLKRGIISLEQSDLLRAHFTKLARLDVRLGLSHGDLSLDNVIVNEDKEVILIDWGSAEGHLVPHYDLSVILAESLSDDSEEFMQVLRGYGMTNDEYDGIKSQITSLTLLIAVDKVRWAIDRSPQSLDANVAHLNKVLLRITKK